MAILKLLEGYQNSVEVKGIWFLKQVDLSNQYIKNVTEVYAIDGNDAIVPVKFEVSNNIEDTLREISLNNVNDRAYFQYKNEILHLVSSYDLIPQTGYSFYFTATRLSEPISDLEADIDIPNTLVPLFVQKVLSNVYQLQGKETPLTIKRRIKELE